MIFSFIISFLFISMAALLFIGLSTSPMLALGGVVSAGFLYWLYRIVDWKRPRVDETSDPEIERAKQRYVEGDISLAEMENLIEHPLTEQQDEGRFEVAISQND